MARRRAQSWWRRLLWGALAAVVVFAVLSLAVERWYADRIVSAAAAPERKVALVFGAGLSAAEVPSPILAERLDAAIALYQAKKVQKLLVSGDNSDRFHDETRAMRLYALDHGVPKEDVIGDYAGLSTYDSCVRARQIFQVTSAILVTQRFHLPRALFIANSVGIDAYGVAADEGRDPGSAYALRETLSRPVALFLVLFGAEPRFLGEKLPIE